MHVVYVDLIEYLFVQWSVGEEHSVLSSKFAVGDVDFTVSQEVLCKLDDGDYTATILAVG